MGEDAACVGEMKATRLTTHSAFTFGVTNDLFGKTGLPADMFDQMIDAVFVAGFWVSFVLKQVDG
jgi:hypothetical protein